jgi:hypothetical protein
MEAYFITRIYIRLKIQAMIIIIITYRFDYASIVDMNQSFT